MRDPRTHRYSTSRGIPGLRRAQAAYYRRRFGVALDPESEALVQRNLARIAEGRTVIIVSHRLASLVSADAILVLERGKAVDYGTHRDLLSRCASYRQLWNQQHRHLRQERAS